MRDRKLLEALLHRFGGGPVWLDNIAAAIGESTPSVQDILTPAAGDAMPGMDHSGHDMTGTDHSGEETPEHDHSAHGGTP
mgnify:CR=1 FL=1